jgi:hypothetical protein
MKVKENIMFINLGFSLPRQTRKVKAQANVDSRRLTAAARLYSGDTFKAIKSHELETRDCLLRLAIQIPSAFRGVYVLPAALTDRVFDLLRTKEQERAELIEAFLTNGYQQEREAARIALRDSFRETDFPPADVLRSMFRMSWRIFNLEVPSELPEDIRKQEQQKFKENLNSVFAECRAALRETLADLVGHLADKLSPEADGSKKRLFNSTIENLREFLDTINSRDITSDASIRQLSDKARQIIGEYKADDLKGSFTGDRVRDSLTAVKKEIDGLIKREGSRKIDLDLD